MPKSNLQLLKEALEAGDIIKAQELTAKLEKPKSKPKPKPKPKVATKQKKEIESDSDEHIFVTSMNNGEGRTFTDEFGKQHKVARRVSMAGTKFVNNFNPKEYDELNDREKKVEKVIKKGKVTPRPGKPGSDREVAEKVEVRCCICNRLFMAWPWEAQHVPGDTERNFRCDNKRCVIAR